LSVATFRRTAEAAAAPYLAADRFAWHFARGKLRRDPVFRYLLESGLIPEGARLLDLGCGQGLLAALLRAAGAPRIAAYRGVELACKDVARAQRALGAHCGVVQGDLRTADFGPADAVVILDVLHYLAPADQDLVLRRVRESLAPTGVLLVRTGNSAGGLRFRISTWADWFVALARGHGAVRFHWRSVAQWQSALQSLGFVVRAEPMSRGTPFANVLLVARLLRRS
jgi:2-polyprenyl-3-methyl-5-hydroxy-6-metoxy-1,4-benzoquinol methylase